MIRKNVLFSGEEMRGDEERWWKHYLCYGKKWTILFPIQLKRMNIEIKVSKLRWLRVKQPSFSEITFPFICCVNYPIAW